MKRRKKVKPMREKIVLAFDVGTQSSRALLINNRGEILAKSQQQHKPPYVSPYPDWAERDADLYFKDICTCSLDLKERFPDIFERIEAVSVRPSGTLSYVLTAAENHSGLPYYGLTRGWLKDGPRCPIW